jgi:hypothetical protein
MKSFHSEIILLKFGWGANETPAGLIEALTSARHQIDEINMHKRDLGDTLEAPVRKSGNRAVMAYFKFISMSFQRSISYRVEYFMSVLNAFLYIFIFTSVWKTLIPAGKSVEGLTREDMIAYAVLSTLVKATFGRNDSLLSSRIKSGDIAADLLKPFYFR